MPGFDIEISADELGGESIRQGIDHQKSLAFQFADLPALRFHQIGCRRHLEALQPIMRQLRQSLVKRHVSQKRSQHQMWIDKLFKSDADVLQMHIVDGMRQ